MGQAIVGGGGIYETNELPDSMAAARGVPCDGPPYILLTGLSESR